MMNFKKYMTFKASYKKYDGLNEDTRTSIYRDPVDINVFKYGKDIFVRENSAGTTVTAQVYLCDIEIKPKDIIDGQVVKSVNHYPESWDSKNVLYEALTWRD